MNWLEVEDGFLVNLDKVKAVQRQDELSSVLFFEIGESMESVTCRMPYESLKSLLKYRSNTEDEAKRDSTLVLQRILSQQRTPVP